MSLLERHKYEERFHDEWARSISLEALDPDGLFTCPTAPENAYALSLLGDLTNKRLLDMGCGGGEACVALAKQGACVQAIDISSMMVNVTERLGALHYLDGRLQATQMAAEEMDFADDTFDLVHGRDVLHHLDLDLAIPEIHRVLKTGGKAVFIEPLGHNPAIAVYRRLSRSVRTPYERALSYSDISRIGSFFREARHKEFQLSTLAIFVWFFVVERAHPNESRYWKKIIEEASRYSGAFKRLQSIDDWLLVHLPVLRRFCWVTVIGLVK